MLGSGGAGAGGNGARVDHVQVSQGHGGVPGARTNLEGEGLAVARVKRLLQITHHVPDTGGIGDDAVSPERQRVGAGGDFAAVQGEIRVDRDTGTKSQACAATVSKSEVVESG